MPPSCYIKVFVGYLRVLYVHDAKVERCFARVKFESVNHALHHQSMLDSNPPRYRLL